jgi:hypothetical protein
MGHEISSPGSRKEVRVAETPSRPHGILVLDDDEQVRNLVRRALGQRFHVGMRFDKQRRTLEPG